MRAARVGFVLTAITSNLRPPCGIGVARWPPNDTILTLAGCTPNGLPYSSIHQRCGGACRLFVRRRGTDNEGARYHPDPHIVCCAIRASRYAVAVGVSPDDQRIPA